MTTKYEINLNLLINNFKNASAAHGTDSLAAIVFGSSSNKTISNVFFVSKDPTKIQRAVEWLRLMIPQNCELLGSDDSCGVDIPKFQHLKLNASNLKSMSAQKLATRMLTVKANETLSIPVDGVNVRVQFKIQLPTEVSKFATQLDEFKSRIESLHFVDEEQTFRIDGTQTNSSVKSGVKNMKKDSPNQKTYFCVPAVADSVDEVIFRLSQSDLNSSNNHTFEFSVLLRVSTEISDQELHKQICQHSTQVLEQAHRLFTQKDQVFDVDCFTFQFPGYNHWTSVVLPSSDEHRSEFVDEIGVILNLTHPKLSLSSTRALQFNAQPQNGLLVNPHEFLKGENTNPIGQLATVNGIYHYHHYMQDEFDDSGWGCAYRSFQTVCSWLRSQKHTDKPIPTHKDIQQCLVDIGDKTAKFVGSKQWIGSTELSFCMETMFGINSRILTTNSGAEIGEHARQLLYHFENHGGPVMIGGGQLAHTILGIDYNTKTGDCRYLVLDPHYTGDEQLDRVLAGGWCGWKSSSFWKKNDFYNLLLPLTSPLN
ncbi:putative Ufm1-specific protease [Aphelenchoides besseyi]|nr:putative Ufm1-specific protease [Aphelenchoides besseyi]